MPVVAGLAVTVNGIAMQCEEGSSVEGLLRQLCLPIDRVAVERNRRIVQRDERESVAVEPGDAFEIVTFVGGG